VEHKQSVIFNGEFFYTNSVPLTFDNRAFMYGDAVFETMLAVRMRLPLFNRHIARLSDAARLLMFGLPKKFSIDPDILFNEIIRLLNKNKHYIHARVRLHVFRKAGGLFTPDTNEVDYLIQTEAIKLPEFNPDGLFVSIFDSYRIQPSTFTPYKLSGNFRIHILAGNARKLVKADDMLIRNTAGNFCESISSNLFFVSGKTVYTPPVSDGCVAGVVRSIMPKLCESLNYNYIEQSLSDSEVPSVEEIFLTNTISGVRSLKALNLRRFFTNVGKKFSDELNKNLASEVLL